MGLLQSCQNEDTRMSVPLDASFIRNASFSHHSSADFTFQQSKLKLFGDIFHKKHVGNKTQFVLQTHFLNRNPQVISHQIKIYEDSASFMHQKGNKLKITNCISDPNRLNETLYTMRLQNKQQDLVLRVVPFNRYEEERFKSAFYQATMYHRCLQNQNSMYSFAYHDCFVIESGIDKDQNDKCMVLMGDYGIATLHQIIAYRKLAQCPWGQKQFQTLCYQLIRGLSQLHQKNILHRDIRPHNIIYSPIKKSYLISSMGNSLSVGQIFAKNSTNPNIGLNLAGVPYYLPKYLAQIGSKEDFSEYYNYNGYQVDVYALAVTLLNALFLDEFMPVQILVQSITKYSERYPFLILIKSMLSDNPPQLSKVLKSFPQPSTSTLDESSSVQSLRYRLKPQDESFVSRKKSIAQGYYNMFMYDEWVQEINEVVNYYELNKDHMQLGEIYKQIADIYAEHHQIQSNYIFILVMEQYYGRASKIFLQISQECLQQKKNQEAIKYLEKGIDANRKGYKSLPNPDLAFLLNKLAMVHHGKAEYQVARAFQQESLEITGKVMGQNSPQYAEMLVDCAKIQSEFQEFKQAQNMLKAGLKIIEKKEQTNQHLRIKAKLLQSLGSNFRMKAIERRDKCDVYRKKAEESLLDALEITERIEGSIHPQVGSVLMNLGNVYFDRKQFDKAKKSYQRALMIKQHSFKSRHNVQVGQCLTYLANSQKFLKQYDSAIRHYDQAIEVFRKAYGNDHNQNTAVAIGNLGLVYKEIGKKQQQKQYLSLAKTILKDLFGQQCPDYQYFDRQMSR